VIHDENRNELDTNMFVKKVMVFPVVQRSQWALLRFLMLYFYMMETSASVSLLLNFNIQLFIPNKVLHYAKYVLT
jgi:hypothetical protein